jgi:hypothetical protein
VIKYFISGTFDIMLNEWGLILVRFYIYINICCCL